jgi:hypothetical protein
VLQVPTGYRFRRANLIERWMRGPESEATARLTTTNPDRVSVRSRLTRRRGILTRYVAERLAPMRFGPPIQIR